VDAKILKIEQSGRNKYYFANKDHPMFPEIQSILQKTIGLNHINDFISNFGDIDQAYVSGDYARGIDSGVIDLVLVGKLEHHRVYELLGRVELLIKRKIRPLILNMEEFAGMNKHFNKERMLMLWGEKQSQLS